MTLGFSQKFPWGEPTNFLGKIWCGLGKNNMVNRDTLLAFILEAFVKDLSMPYPYDFERFKPKIHTMRLDPHNRWNEGRLIHMVYNNRTKDRFQFAPTIKCTGIQAVDICHYHGGLWLHIDECPVLSSEKMLLIANNDGFDSEEQFFKWFKEPMGSIKLIHWTQFRYQ